MAKVTNKEVLDALSKIADVVKDNSSNGTLDRISERVDQLVEEQKNHTVKQEQQFSTVNTAIRKLEKRLYNPDDGVVVKVNANSRVAHNAQITAEKNSDKLDQVEDKVDDLNAWKSGITKFVWILIPGAATAIAWAVQALVIGK